MANEVEALAEAQANAVQRRGYEALRKSIPRTWRLWRGVNFSVGEHISIERVRGPSGDAYRIEVDISWDLDRPDHICVSVEVMEDAPKRRVRLAQRLLLVGPNDDVHWAYSSQGSTDINPRR